jgi:hypothetical protein
MQALECKKRGEPIYNCYGLRCNFDIFFNFGFIDISQDGIDNVVLTLELDKNDPDYQKRIDFFEAKPTREINCIKNLDA